MFNPILLKYIMFGQVYDLTYVEYPQNKIRFNKL